MLFLQCAFPSGQSSSLQRWLSLLYPVYSICVSKALAGVFTSLRKNGHCKFFLKLIYWGFFGIHLFISNLLIYCFLSNHCISFKKETSFFKGFIIYFCNYLTSMSLIVCLFSFLPVLILQHCLWVWLLQDCSVWAAGSWGTVAQHLGQPHDRGWFLNDAHYHHDVCGCYHLWPPHMVHRGSVPRAVWNSQALVLLRFEVILVWE